MLFGSRNCGAPRTMVLQGQRTTLSEKVSALHPLPDSIFLTSLLEYNCYTMLCQFLPYNKVKQLYVYIYLHIPYLLRLPPILPIPPLQVITKNRADLPVLWGCFPLAIYFTFGSVYMSMPLSHIVPAYPSPSLPVSSSPFSTSASLFRSCPQVLQNHFFSVFFRFHIYVLAYGICFSLSDLLHSV